MLATLLRNRPRLCAAVALALAASLPAQESYKPIPAGELQKWAAHLYDGARPREYTGERLGYVALPLGGIGTGSVAIDGRGRLIQWQIFNNFNKAAQVNDTFFGIWARPVGKVVDFIRRQGVDVVGYLTSGHITPLIPTLLEVGVNLHQPLECAAGIDARDLRRQFGRDILMIGNISRQSLMDGPAAVEREFRAKVPPLMEAGGYIPAIDDVVMPDMPYASLRRYVELTSELSL